MIWKNILFKRYKIRDKMNKIYIIGPIGSGKTTFSKKLSEKYNIKKI